MTALPKTTLQQETLKYMHGKPMGSLLPQVMGVQTLSAVCAGLTSSIFTNPLDVLKTRLQVRHTHVLCKVFSLGCGGALHSAEVQCCRWACMVHLMCLPCSVMSGAGVVLHADFLGYQLRSRSSAFPIPLYRSLKAYEMAASRP